MGKVDQSAAGGAAQPGAAPVFPGTVLPGGVGSAEFANAAKAKAAAAASPPRWRAGMRRLLKAGVASALIGLAVYAVLSQRGIVSSDNAVVSAYRVTLRSPIEGYVSALGVQVGDEVSEGMPALVIQDSRLNDQRLVDLEAVTARWRTELAASERQLEELSLLAGTLDSRNEAYRRRAAANFQGMADEADRQREAREAKRDGVRRDIGRRSQLAAGGFAPQGEIDRLRAEGEAEAREAEALAARAAYLRGRAQAVEAGILVEGGGMDVPYSSQRVDEVNIRITEVRRATEALRAQLKETEDRLYSERARVALLRSAQPSFPLTGMVWKVLVSNGERVSVGDPVMELIDCGRAFVVAAVSQDRFSDVVLGGRASFRLSGENEVRHGAVQAITGESTLAEDRNLAGTPMAGRGGTVIARVEAPPSPNHAGQCLVGRTVRVNLPARTDGLIDRVLNLSP